MSKKINKINVARFEKDNKLKQKTFHRNIKPKIIAYAKKHNLLNDTIGKNPDIALDNNNIVYLISTIHKHKEISLKVSIKSFLN